MAAPEMPRRHAGERPSEPENWSSSPNLGVLGLNRISMVPTMEDDLLTLFDNLRHELSIFMNGVCDFIGQHPKLTKPGEEIVHSCKKRLKDRDHLAAKIRRKCANLNEVTRENFFTELTDLAGVRILHLFQEQFGPIDAVIRERVQGGDWCLAERPKAYTWDPESVQFFRRFDLDVIEKWLF